MLLLPTLLSLVLTVPQPSRGAENQPYMFNIRLQTNETEKKLVLDLRGKNPCPDAIIATNFLDSSRPSQYWEHYNTTMIRNVFSGLFLTVEPVTVPINAEILNFTDFTKLHSKAQMVIQMMAIGGPLQQFQFDGPLLKNNMTNKCLVLALTKYTDDIPVVVDECTFNGTTYFHWLFDYFVS